MTAVFVFDYFSGRAEPGDDIDEVEWFSRESAERYINPAHAPFLNAYLQGSE